MDLKIFDQLQLFETLSLDERKDLATHFVIRQYPKKALIINEGDDTRSLYVILKGKVKIYLADKDGKEVILNTLTTGDYFGEMSLLDDGPRSASVITLEGSQFAVLNKPAFIDCISDNPQISFKIMQELSSRLRALSGNIRSLALMDVYGRVARLLLELAVEQDGQKIINEKLTQNDIAAHTGASAKMVGRIMQELKKGGYVRKEGQSLIIDKPFPARW